MAKIFLSHRTADKDVVIVVAEYLQRLGHEVWLDVWSIKLGDSIVSKINEGLSEHNVILLFCSAHSSLAPWISREWMSALARKLGGETLQIIPVLLPEGRLPVILADISYVSVKSINDTSALHAIALAVAD